LPVECRPRDAVQSRHPAVLDAGELRDRQQPFRQREGMLGLPGEVEGRPSRLAKPPPQRYPLRAVSALG
jgi:hypothetical protein